MTFPALPELSPSGPGEELSLRDKMSEPTSLQHCTPFSTKPGQPARALHTSVSPRHPSPTGSPPHEAYPSLMKGYGTEQTRGSKLVNVSSAHRRRVAIARLSVSPGVHPIALWRECG